MHKKWTKLELAEFQERNVVPLLSDRGSFNSTGSFLPWFCFMNSTNCYQLLKGGVNTGHFSTQRQTEPCFYNDTVFDFASSCWKMQDFPWRICCLDGSIFGGSDFPQASLSACGDFHYRLVPVLMICHPRAQRSLGHYWFSALSFPYRNFFINSVFFIYYTVFFTWWDIQSFRSHFNAEEYYSETGSQTDESLPSSRLRDSVALKICSHCKFTSVL